MERERQSDGNAIATELLAIADSWLFRGWAMPLGFSLGLWSLRTVRMRCVWRVRSTPSLCSSPGIRSSPRLCWAALLSSVVKI